MTQTGLFDTSLPVAGKAPRQRHASHSGAVHAAKDRPSLTLAYINLLKAVGPLSDQQAAKALGRGLSSICSVRGGLADRIVDSGRYEVKTWPDGFQTKRTLWAVAK